MNKQLTKKTIAIAASAALMASVALSGSAFASGKLKGKPDKNDPIANGDRTSISIYQTCDIQGDDLHVHVTIMDNNADTCDAYGNCTKAQAELTSVLVQGYGKNQQTYTPIGSPWGSNLTACDEDVDPNDGVCTDSDGNQIPDTETLKCESGDAIEIGTTCEIVLKDLCDQSYKALDALTTVDTGPNGNLKNYYAQCKDSDLKVATYCPQN